MRAGHPAAELTGLSSAEVERRRAEGRGNEVEQATSRSVVGIVRANVATRFNAIVTSLVAIILVFGDPIDAAFGVVMVLNSAIGIVQEVRAKRSLDALRVLVAPSVEVIRDGTPTRVDPAEMVEGDLFTLAVGDQIPVDATTLVSDGLEVDESLLTGESVPVAKAVDDDLLSGSFVVAGTATAEATLVGEASWAQQLTREARTFSLTESELRSGIDQLLTVATWILPPLAALLFWSQIRSAVSVAEGLVWAVAGVVALVPQGLVLLVSMSLALAVIRLARHRVIVQELSAVEGLARIDVLLVDKTGTLTTGNLTVEAVEPCGHRSGGPGELDAGLAALARLEVARSATMDAIRTSLPPAGGSGWEVVASVPFSSVRKWSGATFAEHGTWILGAPEILLDAMSSPSGGPTHGEVGARVDTLTGQARRVLLVARADGPLPDGEELPPGLEPAALISLKEEVRPDAAEIMAYFARQGVAVKVVSGDNPRTVAAVAAELGLGSATSWVDARSLDSVASVSEEATVFGRVRPEQKRELVQLLQAQGHTVAMTGDGVNDIPSLKAADIGIAMNTATQATRASSQLVLLDGHFARLPSVVSEGRRVIANMERVSRLFVTKTVYAALLALIVGVAGVPFPFLPRHLTVVATITIGIPAFILSFRSSDEPCRPGYLRRVLIFAVPAGLVAGVATYVAYGLARSALLDADLAEARVAATMTLIAFGLFVLFQLMRPLDRLEAGLLAALCVGSGFLLVPSPLSDVYALALPSPPTIVASSAVAGAAMVTSQFLLTIGGRLQDRLPSRWPGRVHLRPRRRSR